MRKTTPEYRIAWLKTRKEKSIKFLWDECRYIEPLEQILRYIEESINTIAEPDKQTFNAMMNHRHAFHQEMIQKANKEYIAKKERYKEHRKKEYDAQREADLQYLDRKDKKKARKDKIKTACCIL